MWSVKPLNMMELGSFQTQVSIAQKGNLTRFPHPVRQT
jgi:hypothetical protein